MVAELRRRVAFAIVIGDEQGGSYYPESLFARDAVDVVRFDVTCMGSISGMGAVIEPARAAGRCDNESIPVSMVIGDAELMDSFGPGGHSTAFRGYAAGAAGANAVLDVFESDDILSGVERRVKYLLTALEKLEEQHPASDRSKERAGISLSRSSAVERPRNLPPVKPRGPTTNSSKREWLYAVGLLRQQTHVRMFASPLGITEAKIDGAVEALDKVIGAFEQQYPIGKAQ